MLFRFNQWQHTVLRKFMLEIPAWNMTILLYRVLSYLSRDISVGYVTLRPSLSRSIRKIQHISREKDVVHFNKQQCNTRDYVLNDLLNN